MRSLCLDTKPQLASTPNLLAMFVTGSTFHPAALGYTTKKSRKLQRQKSYDLPNSKRPYIRSNSWSCQVQLLMALQGMETNATARHLVATTINELEAKEKMELIDFLQKVGIPAAMENNACKAFACTTKDLENVLNEDNITALNELWKLTQTQIIPTLEAMLYPLKVSDCTFNVQKIILSAFRDRVLARIFLNVRSTLPSLQSMIFYISFTTSDSSAEYETFSKIADNVLRSRNDDNCDNGSTRNSTDEGCRYIRRKPKIKPRLSEPAFDSPPESIPKKERSTTLPTRSVHWADLEPAIRKISLT